MTIADMMTDRLLQRPRGRIARMWWRDMKAHHGIFRDTLEALDLTPDDHLLEIGCGGGTFVKWALATGCRATAVDHSVDMVELAKSNNADAVRAGGLDVVCAPAENLPFPEGQFTCAALMNVLFFLDAPAALTELKRVLAPGGRAVVHTVAPNPPAKVVPPTMAKRMRLYGDEELLACFTASGFTDGHLTRIDGAYQLVTATAKAAGRV
ncbi:class I SAM-dependent methyltransferase [Nocardia sp. NBC_00881]|uniref:class I SAM-dependent methyltransferase n=1 Tax=Nocardia sp. NBC_00881 TaxID=2975995 RepID=UPI0038675467|nr:class I SAM-dependent methyltransferase [Nocardia sp. NBC_00881]